ncbi:MAG: SPOR domain-containing protein [Bacillota bacterium]|nr:SPOR domain-containing protein [Bacillota bacterium]
MNNKKAFGNRYRGRGTSRRRSAGSSYKLVAVILCISVGCGYAAAKYVVEPVVNYVPSLKSEQSGKADTSESVNVLEDDVEVMTEGNVSGYAIQYGCYSGKAAAEAARSNIDVNNLQIIKQDQMYKIVGEIYDDKNKAKKALGQLPEGVSAFVTEIYKQQ